jgi:heterodisulfide reductase subunit C
MATPLQWNDGAFLREVERRSGTPVSACYQCHKCSTGCPVGPETDFSSSQLMRLIHLGADAEALGCRGIWLCASCEACTTRCPMAIDIAGVMDTLRMMAVERKVASPDARGQHFNATFLGSVRRLGRVYELGALAGYKLRSGALTEDLDKVPMLLKKHKLALLPRKSGSAAEVRKVFARADAERQDHPAKASDDAGS